MKNKVMTTLHLHAEVRDQFKKLAGAQKLGMGEVVEELMKEWIDQHSSGSRTDRIQMNQAASLLTRAVCDQLTQHPEWAMEALVGAGMGLPGASVFSSRIAHFSDEKQELGKRLAHWMLSRSLSHIGNGRKVVLVCDSGTTVFWFLKAFGEAINESFEKGKNTLKLKDLVVVTNNIPGAESFVTYSSLHTVPLESGKKARISDLVDCRILAGTFLPEYAAITGTDTEIDLETYSKQAKEAITKKQRGPDCSPVFIAITTGNWIALQGPAGATLPHLFARGRGHGAFKRKVLEVCDEIFAIGPLGKLLLDVSVSDLNKRLQYSSDAANPLDQSYEEIATPAHKARVTKVVSTIRQRQSVLRDHSALLCKSLGQYSVLDPSSQQSMDRASGTIEEIDHLLFPFDQFSEQTIQTQLEIELPHKRTQDESFKREIFSIRS